MPLETPYAKAARGAAVRATWFAFAMVAIPMTAAAGELGLKVEPGVAIPLSQPQSQRFDLGGGGAAKLLFGLTPYLDATAGVSAIALPRSSSSLSTGTATAWGYGGGLQLKRPHDAESLHEMSPWVDADALYIRTGPLNRFGFAAAAGLAFPVGEARSFRMGPYVRYEQIVGRGDAALDGRDAKVLLVGLSLEFGSSAKPAGEVAHEAAVEAAPAVADAAAAPVPEPDRDRDGTADRDDLCPDVAGPISNHGCPVYDKVVVKPEELELKERIQFAWNSPAIEQASHPALDEVAMALQDNKNASVLIEGHASSEGADENNQRLSEQRAQAVLDYLVGHGVAKERLGAKGFSSSVPIETNTTAAGRESNRRVEFLVTFLVVNPRSGK